MSKTEVILKQQDEIKRLRDAHQEIVGLNEDEYILYEAILISRKALEVVSEPLIISKKTKKEVADFQKNIQPVDYSGDYGGE